MNLKKVLIYTGVAFLIFFLLSNPARAGQAVNNALSGVATAANQLSTFVSQFI